MKKLTIQESSGLEFRCVVLLLLLSFYFQDNVPVQYNTRGGREMRLGGLTDTSNKTNYTRLMHSKQQYKMYS